MEFNRYIRPQLRSIVQEFYQMLKGSHEIFDQLIPVKHNIKNLHEEGTRWYQQCSKTQTQECYDNLIKLVELTRTIDNRLLRLQTLSHLTLASESSLDNFLDSYMEIARHSDNISLLNFKVLHTLNQLMAALSPGSSVQTMIPQTFIFELDQLQTYTEILLLSPIETETQEFYRALWNDFIKKIENNILARDDKEFLKTNIEDMNFIWNAFNMRISKNEINTSKKVLKLAENIKNRWNSILRIVIN